MEHHMTEPGIHFSERLPRRNLRRAVLLVGAILAIVVGAAVTMGASPSASPATPGTTAQPQASGDPGTPDNGSWKGSGRGDFGGRGRFGPITITSINGSNLSLATEDGWTRTIAVTSATTITKDGETIAASDLAVGDEIRLRQSRASDGTFTITAIDVVQPKIAGTVTAVTADSITVTGRDGASHTITTTNSTTYRLGDAAASRSDVVVGSKIVATGSAGTGDSFTATMVTIKVPRVAGTVTAVTASTITIQQRDGSSLTINVDADTTFGVAGNNAATLGDVAIGMKVIAAGRQNADGSFDATAIRAGNGRFHVGPSDHDDATEPSPSGSPSTTG
jgi:Domain of unknown function (DUF5666)